MKNVHTFKMFLRKILCIADITIDTKVQKIMKFGIKFNFVLTLISTLILSIYITSNPTSDIYTIGSLLLKSSTMFIVIFIIFGICFNQLLKEKN